MSASCSGDEKMPPRLCALRSPAAAAAAAASRLDDDALGPPEFGVPNEMLPLLLEAPNRDRAGESWVSVKARPRIARHTPTRTPALALPGATGLSGPLCSEMMDGKRCSSEGGAGWAGPPNRLPLRGLRGASPAMTSRPLPVSTSPSSLRLDRLREWHTTASSSSISESEPLESVKERDRKGRAGEAGNALAIAAGRHVTGFVHENGCQGRSVSCAPCATQPVHNTTV